MENKTCLTCKYEPKWEYYHFPNPGYDRYRGQCRFVINAKGLRKYKLPQGGSFSSPWVDEKNPKKTCAAWEKK